MSLLSGRGLRLGAVTAAVAAGFGAGVLTGVVGSRPAAPAADGVIDEAADRISADAARVLDRDALERAAVEGMLQALGDEWSSYYDPEEFVAFEDAVEGRDAEPTARPSESLDPASEVTVRRLPRGVVRLTVAGFPRGVGRQVREAVHTEAAHSRGGIVLDLRGNAGGLLTEAVEVASAFLRDGPVVVYERRGAAPRTLAALGSGDTRTPLVVLVDGSTASAAEVVAAALQDRNRAVVVGSRTFGKGSVQEPARLSDGSAIELTVGRYLTPSGRRIDRVGIAPDVLVRPGQAPEVAERRALDVLEGLMAARRPVGRG